MKKNILLLLISMGLCLAVFETALRVLAPEEIRPPEKPHDAWAIVPERVYIEHHPMLGWYHQRSREAVMVHGRGREVEVHTNASGFRGLREYDRVKPEGVRRILVLGDSFAFGFGVKDDETFPAVLEKRHPGIEVMNLGVAGYGVDQIALAYREIGRHYGPDEVILAIFPEDFWRALRAFSDSGHAKPYYSIEPSGELKLNNVPVPQPYELKSGQFPDVLDRPAWQKFLRHSRVYKLLVRAFLRVGKGVRLVDPDTTTKWILGKGILDQLVADLRADGIEPLMLIVPPDGWIKDYTEKSLRKSMIRYARQRGIGLIDLTPVFYEAVQAAELTDYYIRDDWHWTPRGHALVADLVEPYYGLVIPASDS